MPIKPTKVIHSAASTAISVLSQATNDATLKLAFSTKEK